MTLTAPLRPAPPRPAHSGRGRALLSRSWPSRCRGGPRPAVGSRTIPAGTVVDVLFHPDGSDASTIVHDLRLPRTVLAVAVGVALGVAGALMRSHPQPAGRPGPPRRRGRSRSPSCSASTRWGHPADRLRLVLPWPERASPPRAVLRDRVLSPRPRPGEPRAGRHRGERAALAHPGDPAARRRHARRLPGLVGRLRRRAGWDVLWQVLPFLLVGLLLAALSASGLDLLQLGDDVASALGCTRARHKVVGVAAVVLLTGAATAACGPIGFVRAGGAARRPVPGRHRPPVGHRVLGPARCAAGAAHRRARPVLVRPAELPVGIVMALVGGPAFVLLVRRSRVIRL